VRRLQLEVLTVEGVVLDASVEAVVVPLVDGWKGVLPGHAGFEARLMRGEILFRSQGAERTVATLGGTLVVELDRVTVLTGAAALDRDLAGLEQEISGELEALQTMEAEAEKHFGRVYRQMAETFRRAGGRHA
jgi:F0F1-type ATP synthase epsilon subunit